MLDGTSSVLAHRVQNASLILLSIAFLPLNTFLLVTSYVFSGLFPRAPSIRRRRILSSTDFRPKTVLITGVGMTKGLCLARLFYEAGHTVIGAEFEPNGALAYGRVSKSIKKFYRLTKPLPTTGSAGYIQDLLNIINNEHISLWVSCSGVASAVTDGEAKDIIERRTNCLCIQFDVQTTQTLHEKDSFIAHTEKLGLAVPETHTILSHADASNLLTSAPADRKYIMKPIGLDDVSRANLTLLPLPTPSRTASYLSKFRITKTNPWILQQHLPGPEYCTHALVIRGRVAAFVACPSSDLLMHYVALPSTSPLSQTMLRFTQDFAAAGGKSFTGHLSFDFMAGDTEEADGTALYPIECNPRAHTAVALFRNTAPALVDAYVSLLEPGDKKVTDGEYPDPVTPITPPKIYWSGHDFVTLLALPVLNMLKLRYAPFSLEKNLLTFLGRLLWWQDGTFELWDPLPWWWLYHVYWPLQFWACLREGRKWSRMNVSTTKMFEC